MAADTSPAEYDLTHKIGGYLDRHLVLPILEFLSEHAVSSLLAYLQIILNRAGCALDL